jgi:lipoprotein NlpD
LLILLEITDGNIETTSMRCSEFNVPRRLKFALLLLVSLFLYSCTTYHVKTVQPRGVYHRIKSGDTLWNVARAYGVNIQELAEVNNITDPNMIEVGSVVFIPDANQVVEDVMKQATSAETTVEKVQTERSITPAEAPKKEEKKAGRIPLKSKSERSSLKDSSPDRMRLSSSSPVPEDAGVPADGKSKSHQLDKTKDKEDVSGLNGKISITPGPEQKSERIKPKDNGGESEKIKFDRDRFIWPVKGKVRSKFGIQPNGMYYNGIRISAREGTTVLASAGGTIIFSGPLKDFGETVIIKHEDNYATVYTHLNNRMVKVDDRVKRGSRIAFPGQVERGSEAYINFEIRHKNKSRNPLFFLP